MLSSNTSPGILCPTYQERVEKRRFWSLRDLDSNSDPLTYKECLLMLLSYNLQI